MGYPYEREICFPPLTSMQVMGTHIEDGVLVVDLRLNLNLTIGAIEEVISKRRKVALELCEGIEVDLQHLAASSEHADDPTIQDALHKSKRKLEEIMARGPEVFNDDTDFLSQMQDAFAAKGGLGAVVALTTLTGGWPEESDPFQLKRSVEHLFPHGDGLEGMAQQGWQLALAEGKRQDPVRLQLLQDVRQNGVALRYASDELQADHEVVLAAVTKNGCALQHASRELKADREMVLVAVTQSGSALQYASNELKADRDFVLAAVTKDGWALEYALEFQADREVVLAAVTQNDYVLRFASRELKADRDFMLVAVGQ